jgi:tetratricopeptide (TPR) repeat protein
MEFLKFFLIEQAKIDARNQKAWIAKHDTVSEIKSQLKIAVELGDELTEARLLNQLGNTYAYYSDFDLSETMYRQGLALARQIPDKYLEAVTLINLGLSFKKRLEYKLAYSYYKKALRISLDLKERELEQEIDEHIIELSNMLDLDDLAKE